MFNFITFYNQESVEQYFRLRDRWNLSVSVSDISGLTRYAIPVLPKSYPALYINHKTVVKDKTFRILHPIWVSKENVDNIIKSGIPCLESKLSTSGREEIIFFRGTLNKCQR